MKKILQKKEEHDIIRESMFDKMVVHMKISYKKLWKLLIDKEMPQHYLMLQIYFFG